MTAIHLVPATVARGASARVFTVVFAAVLAAGLSACSALPERPERPVMVDFGPGPVAAPSARPLPTLPPLALSEVEPAGVLDGSTAVLYRLAYTDTHQLLPYAQTRWSMPVAQLVRQRVRDVLGQQRSVLTSAESAALARSNGVLPRVLRLELDEFSHIFDSPSSSAGLVRLRLTLLEDTPEGATLLGQRSITVQRPAASNDARGGVHALAAATDAAAQEIAQWLQSLH